MSEALFAVLDLTIPDAQASVAARLLAEENGGTNSSPGEGAWSSERGLQNWIAHYSRDEYTTYALLSPQVGVLAAASVMHHANVGPEEPYTLIQQFAVYPSVRRQGYGTRLVRHIAEQALEYGDKSVTATYYFARGSAHEKFLAGLPFIKIKKGVAVAATADLILI